MGGGPWRRNRAWERRELRIAKAEAAHDAWYHPHTNLPIARADAAQVQGHYKNLVEAKEAVCELKSYLQIRPVFHSKPEGSSTMRTSDSSPTGSAPASPTSGTCVRKPAKSPRILRQLQIIHLGVVYIKNQGFQALKSITKIPADLNAQLGKLKLIILFAARTPEPKAPTQ
jgi:hypothetical protein